MKFLPLILTGIVSMVFIGCGSNKINYTHANFTPQKWNTDKAECNAFANQVYNKKIKDAYESCLHKRGWYLEDSKKHIIPRKELESSEYDKNGYDKDGYNKDGYNKDGFHKSEFSKSY